MEVQTHYLEFRTRGHTDIIDLTPRIEDLLAESGLQEGQVLVSAVGSTAGIGTTEYEPGLVQRDIAESLERLAPYDRPYAHNQTWGDDNGAAHLRSTFIGTSQTFPFAAGKLLLGTWQQIIFLDFDTRPRTRKVVVQFIGRP